MADEMKTNDILLTIERLIAAGRISYCVLDYTDKDKAEGRELIARYDTDFVYLYSKPTKDDEPVPVITETDIQFKKFVENFIEVSAERKKEGYDPSLWMMLQMDSNNQTGFSAETITKMYKYMEDNFNQMKPYIQQVNVDDEKHWLVPFSNLKTVFFDLGSVISGERIRNTEDVINIIIGMTDKLKEDLNGIIADLKKQTEDALTNINEHNTSQDNLLSVIKGASDNTLAKVNQTITTVQNLANKADYRIRPFTFTVGGSASIAYPVVFRYTNGTEPIGNGKELFMAQLMLSFEDAYRETTLMMGRGNESTATSMYTNKNAHFVFGQTMKAVGGSPAIYDFDYVAAGTYLVYLRGGTTYKVWSKYIENVNVDASLSAKYGKNPIGNVPATVINVNLTSAGRINTTFVETFGNNLYGYNEMSLRDYTLTVV